MHFTTKVRKYLKRDSFSAKPIRAGGGHLVGGGAPGVVRPAPAQDIKRKSIIVGARGNYNTNQIAVTTINFKTVH